MNRVGAICRLAVSQVLVGAIPWRSRIPDKLLEDYGLRKLSMASPRLSRRIVVIAQAGRPLTPLSARFLECTMEVARRLTCE